MTTTYRAELTKALAVTSAQLEALRQEAIRLNAAVNAAEPDSIECVILCAQSEGVAAAQQRTFDAWNEMRAELRAEQDL